MHLKKVEQFGILTNVASCIVTLLVSEHVANLLWINSRSRHYIMPSWGEIFIIVLTPLLLAFAFGLVVPFLSKWNKQPHGRLVTFFTVLWGYLAFELFRTVVIAIQNLYGVRVWPILLWILVILVITAVTIGIWKMFYVWQRHHVRSIVIFFIAAAIPIYILLPLLETYVARLTFFIHFYN